MLFTLHRANDALSAGNQVTALGQFCYPLHYKLSQIDHFLCIILVQQQTSLQKNIPLSPYQVTRIALVCHQVHLKRVNHHKDRII